MQPLDQDAVNLAKAIRGVETKGAKDPYSAKGASQEHGAYQFTPGTWEKASTKFLGQSVPLETATREQQNEVAYKQIKEFKDQGYNPGQIASLWNSGKPDAYLDPNYKGVNKFGVKYDVPAYVNSVYAAYKSIKGSGDPTVTPDSPSTIGKEQYGEVPKPAEDPNKPVIDKVLDSGVSKGIQRFFPGQKVGQAIGTLGGLLFTKAKDLVKGTHEADYYDTSAPTPLQVAGDVAQGALTVASGLPEAGAASGIMKGVIGGAKGIPTAATALGRIGSGALIGAGLTGTGAVAEGKDIKGVAKDAAIGGVTGGVLSAAGEVVRKAAETLPKRFLRSNVGKINDETAEYAVKKGLKNPEKMLAESETSIKTLGKKLGDTLNADKYKNIGFQTQDIVDDVIKKYPDAELTPEIVLDEVKKLAKLKSGLVTKLAKGETLSMAEIHSLNSELGSNVFKTVFDDPAVKAGKDIGAAFYHTVSDRIKSLAPETVPLFDDLSKEYPLRKALTVAINRMGKYKAFNLRDLMAIIAGASAAGPVGAAGAFVGEKLLTSPSANMATGALISKLGNAAKNPGMLKSLLLRNATGGSEVK